MLAAHAQDRTYVDVIVGPRRLEVHGIAVAYRLTTISDPQEVDVRLRKLYT
jgi:hypothetical protein